MKKYFILLVVLVVSLCFLAFLIGKSQGINQTKTEYIQRSKNIPEKDVFTNRDIEHVLYNTPIN